MQNFVQKIHLLSIVSIAIVTGALYADTTSTHLVQEKKTHDAMVNSQQPTPESSVTGEDWLAVVQSYEKNSAPLDTIVRCLRKAHTIFPLDYKICLALGGKYYSVKNFKEAMIWLQKSYILKRTAEAAEKMALSAAALGQWDKAKDVAESALLLDSSVYECRSVLVTIYMTEKSWNSAIDQLLFLIHRGIATPEQYRLLATCCEKAPQIQQVPYIDSILVQIDKTAIMSRQRYAQYCLATSDTAQAISLYKDLNALAPKDPQWYKQLYQLSLAHKKTTDAIRYLQHYLKLDSSNEQLQLQLARLFNQTKDTTKALNAYRKAFARNPVIRGHFKAFCQLLLNAHADAEAITVISAAIQANEADTSLYRILGFLHQGRKEYQKAITAYQEALKSIPKDLQLLTSIAQCQVLNQDRKNAILTYQRIISIYPTAASHVKALGMLQIADGDTKNAIQTFCYYLSLNANDLAITKKVGILLYEAHAYSEARNYLSKVTDSSLQDFSFHITMGRTLIQLSAYSQACDALLYAWKSNSSHANQVQLLPLLARCYEMSNNFQKAADMWQLYSTLPHISDTDAAFKAAYLREKTDTTVAMKQYNRNILQFPNDYRNYVRLGLLYATDSLSYRKAEKVLETSTTLVDTIPIVWQTLAVISRALKNKQKELVALEKVVTLTPKDSDNVRRIGILLFQDKQYNKALKNLQFASKHDTHDTVVLKMLVQCFHHTKQYKDALIVLRTMQTLKPNDPKILEQIIIYDSLAGEFSAVSADFESLIQIDKKTIITDKSDINVRNRLVTYYLKNFDYKAAYTVLQELSVLTPRNSSVFRKLYEIDLKHGNKEEALKHVKAYIALDNSNTESYRILADLLYAQKDFDNALAAYRNALRLQSEIKGIYKNYTALILTKKLDASAIAIIERAIKLGEAEATAYVALGDFYNKQHKYGQASSLYSSALQLEPTNIEALSRLVECQISMGDHQKALVNLEQVVMLKTNARIEYKTLGIMYQNRGNTVSAMQSFIKYLEQSPKTSDDQNIALQVGMYLYKQRLFAKALPYLQLVNSKKFQTTEMLFATGECYFQLKQATKAIEVFSNLLLQDVSLQTKIKIYQFLAPCYESINDQQKALSIYDAYCMINGVHDSDACFKRGYQREQSDKAAALRVYQSNIARFPNDYRNFFRYGIVLALDSTKILASSKALNYAATLVDTIPALWLTLSRIEAALHNEKAELKALQKLVDLQPQNNQAIVRIAALLINAKEYSKAISLLETVLMSSPADCQALLVLARGYKETLRDNQMLDILAKIKKIDDTNSSARLQCYEYYKQTNQSKKAYAELNELINITQNSRYRMVYIQDLIKDKLYDEALQVIVDIKTADPMNIEALMLRASIYSLQKKYDEAIETYKDISYIREDYVPALIARADIYLALNNYIRAEYYYIKALKADPNYVQAELGLALSAKAQNNMAAYQRHLSKAKTVNPNDQRVLKELKKIQQ